jgi:hypothetical protein
MITDGKASFQFQTANIARTIKDKNTMIYMVPVTSLRGDELKFLRETASQPWETNFEQIPGLLECGHNPELFAQKVVAKFCPHAISPTREREIEDELQCVKIKQGGSPNSQCGAGRIHPMQADTPAVCAEMAREQGALAFMLGKGVEKNKCAVVSMQMNENLFEHFQNQRRDPECPGGAWDPNPFWDTYACKAIEDPCGPGSGYGHLDFAHATLTQQDLAEGGKLVYTGIGHVPEGELSLEVTAGSGYTAKNNNKNGFAGSFGMINIKACTSAEFTFTFKVGGSPHTMKEFEVTFFDLDTGGNPNKIWEELTADGWDEMMEAGAPLYTSSVSGAEATVRATVKGVGADNPSDPMMLTPEQISRSVGFMYSEKSSFTVRFDVPCPTKQYNGGRNYMFAFHSTLTPCRI